MAYNPTAVRDRLGKDTCTPRELAVALKKQAHYGNQLAKDDRLVYADDAKKLVDVIASVERINDSADPSRQSTVERHERARSEKAATAQAPTSTAEEIEAPASDEAWGYNYQDAKAKREHWAAEREHAAWRKEAGELMERSEVVAAFADVGATLRSKVEAWSSTLPPQLAGRDEAAIRASLAEQVEQLLIDLSTKFVTQASADS